MRERLAAGLLDPSADHPARREVELLVRPPGADPGRRELPDDPARRPAAGGRRIELDRREFQLRRAALPARVGEPSQVQEEREAFQIRVVIEDRTEGSRVAIYTVPKRTWDDWWEEVAPSLDERTVGVTAEDAVPVPVPSARGDAWAQSAVATASGSASRSGAPAWPCLPDGMWDSRSVDAHPLPRFGHTAVWTGAEMIVWGGFKQLQKVSEHRRPVQPRLGHLVGQNDPRTPPAPACGSTIQPSGPAPR